MLLILGIFTMFWIEVKLIPTLWILLALAAPTFFIMNKGLIAADCTVDAPRVGKK